MIQKIRTFLMEVRQEMGKVSWPTVPELRGSTAVVLVLSLILAVFLFIVDRALGKIMELLIK
jgi:preprotein translocase subunit SecE